MTKEDSSKKPESGTNKRFAIGLARAFAGAIIFSFPILMTMEMWSLSYLIPPYRLAIFILFSIPLLIGLSYFVGFKDNENIVDDIIDAFAGYAIGFVTAAVLLYLFGVIDFGMSYYEIVAKISVQSVTAAVGAMYAQSQLGSNKDEDEDENDEDENSRSSYWGELFLMLVGAIILGMNPAATEEIYLIAYKMSEWQIIVLAVISIIILHAFVYSVGFRGSENDAEELSFGSVFMRFTIVGYSIALIVSCHLLWTFGSLEGLSLKEILEVTIVLSFPAALGAAASRVII